VAKAKSTKRPATLKAPATHPAVLGVGLATVDLLLVAPRMEDRLVDISIFSMQAGGSAANMLAALAVLGSPTRYFGRVGNDDHGRFIERSMQNLGVDTAHLLLEEDRVSPVSVIQIDELSRKRRILRSRGNVTQLLPRDIPADLLAGTSLLVIDGTQPQLQAAIAEKARDKDIPVLLNASQLSGGMGELISQSNIIIGSERFANEVAPAENIADSLRELLSLGPQMAVFTLGEAGAIGLEDTKLVEQEALDVFVADTSGAGDAFAGAFAFAYLAGWPLEKSVWYAEVWGPDPPCPTCRK